MLDVFIVQHHQHQRHCHAVIRAKGGAVGCERSVLYDQLNTLLFKIMLHSRYLLAYHIHMSLEHNSRLVFCALASVFFYDHILCFVLMYPEISVFCKLYKIIADSLFISRTSGDRADFLKKVK